MRFRLKTLLLLFFIVSVVLSAVVPFLRWMDSRPGMDVTTGYYLSEIEDIKKQLGDQSLQDLRVWHLYGPYFGSDYLWQAKAQPEVIECLTSTLKLKPIAESQVPGEFWNMPPERSEIPSWWKPKPMAGAEYYMTPTFRPDGPSLDGFDGMVMYDPKEQRVYVWSQFDF
jgi:hypothetical protein